MNEPDPGTVTLLGACAGLAEALLDGLAQAGHALLLHGRDSDKLAALAERLRSAHGEGLRLATVSAAVEDPELAEQLWRAAEGLADRQSGWVSLIGIPGRMTPDEWSAARLAEVYAVNTAGPLLALRGWGERMRAAGQPGNAVVLSTMQACYPFEGSLPYALSKAALGVGVEILAKEFGAPPALRVNAVAPGVNRAGMALASIERGKYQPYLDAGTIPRYGAPDDIAKAVRYLLTPDLYMTGQTLLLDGGLTLRRDMR